MTPAEFKPHEPVVPSPPWRSPVSGAILAADTPHSLAEAGRRWPVVDAIPYLRVGRDDLAAAALARLDAGDRAGALALLLADQDDWWDGAVPPDTDLRHLVAEADTLTLRDAMGLLGYGRVGDYFAHRWSDPTFMAGLALVEAHWAEPRTAFELACGIGHHLAELMRRGVRCAGGDVVFSKLWLARHWVVGADADLACFDAAAPWPVTGTADLVLCHDAFYFLEPKAEIAARLRALAGPTGTLAIGHVHNRDAANFSAGRAVDAGEIAAFFPDGVVYDDDELTRALAEARAPRPARPEALRAVDAFAVAAGPGLVREPRVLDGPATLPGPESRLVRNPLYAGEAGAAAIAWPSERYRAEYADRATYPPMTACPPRVADGTADAGAARRRELVALPERW